MWARRLVGCVMSPRSSRLPTSQSDRQQASLTTYRSFPGTLGPGPAETTPVSLTPPSSSALCTSWGGIPWRGKYKSEQRASSSSSSPHDQPPPPVHKTRAQPSLLISLWLHCLEVKCAMARLPATSLRIWPITFTVLPPPILGKLPYLNVLTFDGVCVCVCVCVCVVCVESTGAPRFRDTSGPDLLVTKALTRSSHLCKSWLPAVERKGEPGAYQCF
jgi:hypothetical protein